MSAEGSYSSVTVQQARHVYMHVLPECSGFVAQCEADYGDDPGYPWGDDQVIQYTFSAIQHYMREKRLSEANLPEEARAFYRAARPYFMPDGGD